MSDIFIPPAMRVFEIHGVEFTGETENQLKGNCVFCEKEGHFFVNKEDGRWDCKRCGKSGNAITFMAQVIEHWKGNATPKDWQKLSEDRGLPVSALKDMGVVLNGKGYWLYPVKTYKGTMQDIRFWRYGGKMMTTKGRTLGLGGIEQLADKRRRDEPVYICEGEFDGAAMRHLLSVNKAKGIVLCVPGAGVFKDSWVDQFMGREVTLCYDNDNAGDDGSAMAGKKLGSTNKVSYLCWPSSLPEGYDLRDFVKDAIKNDKLTEAWKDFKLLIRKTHRRYEETLSEGAEEPTGPIPTFEEVLEVHKRWFMMTPEMVDGLRICLAVALSNQVPGDPIWLFIVGPAGSGKTAMLTAMDGAPSCVFRSSITPHALISGFKAPQDPSLIPQLHGKTFILKDYTEVLAMNPAAFEEVTGILRGAYDGHIDKSYGNGVVRSYDCHFSMLAGVTAAINGNSRASLGERFLKYQAIKGTGFDADSQIHAAMRNIGSEVRMGEELRDITKRFLSQKIDVEQCRSEGFVPEWVYNRMVALAQLIAILRAQVTREAYKDMLAFRPQQEMGTRLAKQLIKLGIGLALVEGKTAVDNEVYRIIERVAFDTAVGFHLDLVQAAMICEDRGLEITKENLCRIANLPGTSLDRKIEDLLLLGVIEKSVGKNKLGRGLKSSFQLTGRVVELYKRAEVGQDHVMRSVMSRRKKNERLIFKRKV